MPATRLATEMWIPAAMSARGTLADSWLMTSDSANTVQVLLMFTGWVLCSESGPSWLMGTFNTWAITSRKRPVPAAHLSFI